MLAQQCSPGVHHDTMRRIVQVESAFNPFAIGVVGAHLSRQPGSAAEAMATIRWLDSKGYNYSVGLAQVNKLNFDAHGLTAETALQPCPSLRAGSAILAQCFARARKATPSQQSALRSAFSCYESGNFITGFKDGYVIKIVGATTPARDESLAASTRRYSAPLRATSARFAPQTFFPKPGRPRVQALPQPELDRPPKPAQPSALLF